MYAAIKNNNKYKKITKEKYRLTLFNYRQFNKSKNYYKI